MRRAFIAGVVLAAAACQSGRSEKLPAGYAEDIHRICNMEELSGALDLSVAERPLRSGYWLERNLETPEGRKLAATIFPLPPARKAEALRTEARRAGVSPCPTADSWEPTDPGTGTGTGTTR